MMRMTRKEAIQDIREMLLSLVDDDHSVCEVANRYGIFCGGFSQWSFDELKRRFHWIADRHPECEREEFERHANRWLLTAQFSSFGRLPCDLFSIRPASCAGWQDFYEAELAGFYEELFGQPVEVVPDELQPAADAPG